MIGEPLSAALLVSELVIWWDSRWPVEHRCLSSRLGYPLDLGYEGSLRHVCTHGSPAEPRRLDALPSLVDRLRDLVVPGTTRSDEGAHRPVRQGSPAPWDPRAAELLDEMFRGALEHVDSVRRVLGFSSFSFTPRDRQQRALLDQAGEGALRELGHPGGPLDLLQERRPDHWLVRGPLISPKHPERGHRAGAVLRDLRSWHARAQGVLGFGPPRSRALWWMPNPLSTSERVSWPAGPACANRDGKPRLVAQRVTCGHASCLGLALARMGDQIPLWCPFCWRRGLDVDPVSGEVRCPVCVDEDGDPVTWRSAQWAVDVIAAHLRQVVGT